MKILSHRGYWRIPAERNTRVAFERSFSLGYGTETDIRDAARTLVISHDMAAGGELSLDDLLRLARGDGEASGVTLALNIKADGLAHALRDQLQKAPTLDYFVFDMSVPDMVTYLESGMPVFTRMSEVERQPVWLDRASGVWLDGFYSVWYGIREIRTLLKLGKRVCVVSPELHNRPYEPLWEMLKAVSDDDAMMLCTDFPERATHFFRGSEGS